MKTAGGMLGVGQADRDWLVLGLPVGLNMLVVVVASQRTLTKLTMKVPGGAARVCSME